MEGSVTVQKCDVRARQRAMELLEKVGMAAKGRRLLATLSGGQQATHGSSPARWRLLAPASCCATSRPRRWTRAWPAKWWTLRRLAAEGMTMLMAATTWRLAASTAQQVAAFLKAAPSCESGAPLPGVHPGRPTRAPRRSCDDPGPRAARRRTGPQAPAGFPPGFHRPFRLPSGDRRCGPGRQAGSSRSRTRCLSVLASGKPPSTLLVPDHLAVVPARGTPRPCPAPAPPRPGRWKGSTAQHCHPAGAQQPLAQGAILDDDARAGRRQSVRGSLGLCIAYAARRRPRRNPPAPRRIPESSRRRPRPRDSRRLGLGRGQLGRGLGRRLGRGGRRGRGRTWARRPGARHATRRAAPPAAARARR